LVPSSEASMPHIFINGEAITSCNKIDLKPNTRIILGTGSAFLYRNEIRKAEADIQDDPEISYEFAMGEKRKNDDLAEAERKDAERAKIEAETALKMKALEESMAAEAA